MIEKLTNHSETGPLLIPGYGDFFQATRLPKQTNDTFFKENMYYYVNILLIIDSYT